MKRVLQGEFSVERAVTSTLCPSRSASSPGSSMSGLIVVNVVLSRPFPPTTDGAMAVFPLNSPLIKFPLSVMFFTLSPASSFLNRL